MAAPRTFGKTVSALRHQKKMSQEKLAERADIHVTYVSQIERDVKSPTLPIIERLAKALDTTPSRLLAAMDPKR